MLLVTGEGTVVYPVVGVVVDGIKIMKSITAYWGQYFIHISSLG